MNTEHTFARRERIHAGLDELSPGPVLAALLSSIDVGTVSGHDRVVVLQAHARMAAHYQAQVYAAMAAVTDVYVDDDAGPMAVADATEGAAAEIRAALCLTRRAADSELSVALDLLRRLPRVWERLAEGTLDVRRSRVLIDGTAHLPDDRARAVIDAVIDDSGRLTTGQLRARLRRLCIEIDPADADERLRRGEEDRRVVTHPQPDGTVDLSGIGLPPDRVAAITERLNRIARSLRGRDEARTMDQLRADVFCDLLVGRAHGERAGGEVTLNVDLTTLIGLTDSPGELAGYGPVVADVARRVVDERRNARLRYKVTDPATGDVLVGTTRRRPSGSERSDLENRYPTCVFPGCRMPAVDCDLDHTIPWADGGPTTGDNLAPACRHDHVVRHRHRWTYQRLDDGNHRWRSPLGLSYTTRDQPP